MGIMDKQTDAKHLLGEQYRTALNLKARIRLHEKFSSNPYGWHPWVLDHLVLPQTSQILETGCGSGDLWYNIHEQGPAGWKIYLSDFSPGMLQAASQKLGHRLPFSFSIADVQRLPFQAECFDAVIANHMLYHVPDRTRALREIHRVLKPGGRFFAATNGLNHMEEVDELIRRFDPGRRHEAIQPSFNLENGAGELKALFDEVEVDRYPDMLRVIESLPLVEYILSMSSTSDLTQYKREQALDGFIKAELARSGVIKITKAIGLFSAVKN
jgi:SAM-dependent methyltransferase